MNMKSRVNNTLFFNQSRIDSNMWRNYIKKIVIMLCCSMILLACDDTKSEEVNPEKFDPKEFEKRLDDSNWSVRDILSDSRLTMFEMDLDTNFNEINVKTNITYTIYLDKPEGFRIGYTNVDGVHIGYHLTVDSQYGIVSKGIHTDDSCYFFFDGDNLYDKEICDKNDENKVIELKEIYEEKLKKDGFTHEEFYDYLLYRSQQIKNEDSK